jgi:HSP20 family protein
MLFRDARFTQPWQEFDRIREEMNELMNGVDRYPGRRYPALNIWTKEDAAIITAELPGYETKNIDISVVGDELEIRGNRKFEEPGENEQLHRQERMFGEFERKIRLPFIADAQKVKASLKDGILTINLPRAEADKPRKIEITKK